MVAVHLARTALLAGEIDIGVVAASCIRLPQNRGYDSAENLIFSKSGQCRTFSEDADGTIFGSGSGVVVLKRYKDALADGDNIYALIKSTAINNDGSAKFGYAASSVPGQAKSMVKAIATAGISADQISYIECHGTATKIGDPLEICALEKVFRLDTNGKNFCHIGSVKPNIGHLEQAAGIAGLIKVALMIKNRKLVPTINFTAPNPKLKLEQTPFRMALDYQTWEPSESSAETRYAGLNCLGVGGTNVFAVLSEAPETGTGLSHSLITAAVKTNESGQNRQDVICISAKTESQLVDYIKQISTTDQQFPMSSIAYNVNISRSHLPVRYVSLVSDDTDARQWFDHAVKAVEGRKAGGRTLTGQSLCYVCNPVDSVSDDQIDKLMTDYRCEVFVKEYSRLMACDEISTLASWGLTSASELAKTLAFEGALYLQFKSWGLGVDTFIGSGFGIYVELLLGGSPVENWIDDLRKEAEYYESDLADSRFSCFEKMGQVGVAINKVSGKCENTVYRCKPNQIEAGDGQHFYLSQHASFDVKDIWSFLVEALSRGININWDEYYPRGANKKISLPGYPFEKKRYWLSDDPIVS
jgi:acyl transferase domain-containing protein